MADVNSSRIITDTFKASETIPAFAAVSLSLNNQIKNTDWPDIVSVSNFLGIALNAGFGGQDIEVCLFGIVENLNWSFEPMKPVYISYIGTLTQVATNNVLRKIGKALTPTKLFVNVSDLLVLSE